MLSLLCASIASAQDEWAGNVNVFLGGKNLNSAWKPHKRQGEWGIEIDFRKRDWPINVAIDLMGSYDWEVLGGSGSTSEYNFGVRKIWDDLSAVRPFVGGGLSFMQAKVTTSSFLNTSRTDSGSGTGFWFGSGLYYVLGAHFHLGFELKYSDAEVTIGDTKKNAGGIHYGLLIGYLW
jgi:hypothetical protein